MNNGKKSIKWIISGICTITLIFLILGYILISAAQKGLYEEKLNYLQEISLKSAEGINSFIERYISILNAMANFIGGYEEFSVENSLKILAKVLDENQFKRMGIVLPDGKAFTADGKTFDFNDRDYFQKAINGASVVSDSLIDKSDSEKINVFAAPIYHENKIVAAIFATKTQKQFSDTLNIISFNGEGYSYVIKSDGTPIINTTHPNSIGEYDNFFDAMKQHGIKGKDFNDFKTNIAEGKNGSFTYSRNGIDRQLYYSKVGISDWCVVSVIASDVISFQSDKLISNLILLIILIVSSAGIISYVLIRFFQRNNKTLQKIAYTDRVTGYSNWIKFDFDVKKILKNNPNQDFSMIIFDVNKFKVINDVYGHDSGNKVLKFIADTINRNLEDLETFSRTSSDNFNMLMKYVSNENIIERYEKISSEVEHYIEEYKIELSAGIYPIIDRNLDISSLSDRATISKNIAKKQNDIRYSFFKEENRLEILREKEIENTMEAALINNEFDVYLQPKYLISTGEIIGAEALVRWNRNGFGLVPPNEFIPTFEKNGFIKKLDLYMFENVCKLIQRWKNDPLYATIEAISVNISRIHLSNDNLCSDLLDIAKKYNVESNLLEIELTESAIFLDIEHMTEIMHKIKQAGFLLSIDDFGSGYSSLSALKDLPADCVKIDKSFLDKAVEDKRGEKIIESIIDMTKGLGLLSLVEGVETEYQVDMLKKAGCDIAQGYFYSKPITVIEFEKLIKKEKK